MKVVLTHGYFLNEDPAELKVMKPYPPIGILSLSAWLTREEIPNEVFDSTFSDWEEMKQYLFVKQAGITGIYATLMTRFNVLRMIRFIREQQDLRSSVIIIGGPDGRYNAEDYLGYGADVVIPGEGELTLTETIHAVNKIHKGGLQVIPGIIYRDETSLVIQNEERKPIPPDQLPIPARDKIDFGKYLKIWKDHHGYSSITINSMRGCPYSCNWCSKSVFGNSYRRRSPESVVAEMIFLHEHYHPDQVWFTDDVFTISRDWMKKFNQELAKHDFKLSYECISRSDCLDEEMLHLLKSSGCKKLWIGAESGSQKVIDLMNRKISINDTIKIIHQATKEGIKTGTFIMLGYPGEEKGDIIQTARYLKESNPDEMTVAMAYPIKGTKFFGETESQFLNSYDWEKGNERAIRFKRKYSDRFYRHAIRYLSNSFRARKSGNGIKNILYFTKAILSRIWMNFS